MNIRDQVYKYLEEACIELGISRTNLEVSRSQFEHWDYSSPIALKTAKTLNVSPMELVDKLNKKLGKKNAFFRAIGISSPGFINLKVSDDVWQKEVINVLKDAKRYGTNAKGQGKKARVEFVSANPTGPLHFGNARGGPIGDSLANVLEFSGWEVLREYIHNDIGEQVRKLGETIANVAKGEKLGDQEYKGRYIKEIIESIGNFNTPEEAGKLAVDMMLDETLADCEAMGIKFDKVYPESGFVQSGDTERAIAELDNKGFIKEKDGAKWFAPNDEFLKDRETVVVKSDGSYTYFSNDIAYHKIKFSEGYDLVIDVFGANHHGHVPRLQAVIKALGGDVSQFYVILYQWVRFKKGGEVLAMSKRSGNFVTTKEVLEMVGSDAVRFYVLMHDANSHIDFDLDLAKEKSSKNPVFYVQYAHARISSILAKAEKPETRNQKPETSLLVTDYELNLIKKISKLPELVEDVATSFAVNALTTYATELADSFHKFYENCRVLPREVEKGEKTERVEKEEVIIQELTAARLALLEAARIALSNTLRLLGVSAPEKM